MGKVAKNFSLLHRSTNRVGQRPPSSNGGDGAWHEAEEDDAQSRKEKRLSEKRAQRDNGGFFWDNLRGKLFQPYSYKDVDWRISLGIIAKILFSVRVMSSFWSQIADCDEVYNYWEPLHLLVFGRGFQTSRFYVWIHSVPSKVLFPALASSKVAFFHTLRGVIGLVSLVSDVVLYESVCQRLGNSVGRLYIIFSIFSVGMFNAR
ncbi:Plasmid Maintenance Protein containing protein [Aphelenchoides avenae]|nr:Plasmid Maintenance Protein containing protein [Aphelenchus avenae]